MLFTVPNSDGYPEPEEVLVGAPLREMWSDEARAAAIAIRKARAKNPTKSDKAKKRDITVSSAEHTPDVATGQKVAAQVKARTETGQKATQAAAVSAQKTHGEKQKAEADLQKRKDAAAKAAKAAAGKKPKAPEATGEGKNAAGEREINYADGSKVTVHKDGTATHKKADGTESTGKYKDPSPAKPADTPKGYTPDTPESKARDAKTAARKAETARKKAEAERKRAAKAAAPKKQRVLRQKLSRR